MGTQRYLVTGAGGFLGRHFLAALAERNLPVRAMLRRHEPRTLPGDPETMVGDLRRPETLKPVVRDVSHIIHLAARNHRMRDTAEDPLQAFREVNVEGTRLLLREAISAGVERFLFMSSVKVMAEERDEILDETSSCRPESPYGQSKLEAEAVVIESSRQHGLHAVILRSPLAYGPGAVGNVFRLFEAATAGRRLPLGRIHNRRSMIYAGNLVEAALAALESERSREQVYLTADERPYSTRELYLAICAALDKPPLLIDLPVAALRFAGWAGGIAQQVLRLPMPLNPEVVRRLTGNLCLDTTKIRREVGFEPQIDLASAMRATAQWYQGIRSADAGRSLHSQGDGTR